MDINQNKIGQGDNKGQNSPVNNHKNIDFFGGDESFIYIYKKTEKLATALYMVTNLFGDSEPMKWTLRLKVSSLLSFILSFKDVLKFREQEFLNLLKNHILEIVSLLEIANFSGLVSDMNFRILKDEFLNLVHFAGSFEKRDVSNIKFGFEKNFFDIADIKSQASENVNKTYIKNQNFQNVPYKLKDNSSAVNDVTKKSNRQNAILAILAKNDNITISTISQIIKDCSEKTIQRELINLIDRGLVKKTGERRWSRYSLLKN